MAHQYIFTMLGLNKFYGKTQVLDNINLCFYPGAKIGIVGENGSGKSTVLNIMSGADQEFKGEAFITDGFRAGIVLQEPQLDEKLSVRKTLETAFAETTSMLEDFNQLSASMAEPMSDEEMEKALNQMGKLQDRLDAADAWNLDQRLDMAGDALCLPNNDRIIETLSGGEKRRVALAKILLEQPDLLLLDEPTNHLDVETVSWLETQLADYPGTVIIVTHDRYFLDNITKWILELDSGRGIPFEGNYSSWLEQKLQRLTAGNKKESPRSRALKKELDWIRMSNRDRHELARSRIAEYEQLISREAVAVREKDTVIQIAPGPELGKQVIEFDDVSKEFDNELVFEKATFSIPRSAVVGLIGPNGTGKTTMFRMITGELKPDTGTITIGSTVKLGYVEQMRDMLTDDHSLIEEIGGGAEEIIIGDRSVPIRQYLSRFGFKGSGQQKTVNQLSGGEKSRCHLAKVLKEGGNLLLLDEPTNDLDVNTLRMLEDAILDYSGSVLVISHDRFFINRICTHLLVFEGEGRVRWFDGNFQDYGEVRRKELGGSLYENRRNRYRKLVKSR